MIDCKIMNSYLATLTILLLFVPMASQAESDQNSNTTMQCPTHQRIHLQRDKYQEVSVEMVSGGSGMINYRMKTPIEFYSKDGTADPKYNLSLRLEQIQTRITSSQILILEGFPTDFVYNGQRSDGLNFTYIATDSQNVEVECTVSIILSNESYPNHIPKLPFYPQQSYDFAIPPIFYMSSEYSEVVLPTPYNGNPPYSYSLDHPLPSGIWLDSDSGRFKGGFNCPDPSRGVDLEGEERSYQSRYYLRQLTITDSLGYRETYQITLIRSNHVTTNQNLDSFHFQELVTQPLGNSKMDSIPILSEHDFPLSSIRENEPIDIELPKAKYGDRTLKYYGDFWGSYSNSGLSIIGDRLVGVPGVDGLGGIGTHYLHWLVVDEDHDSDELVLEVDIEKDTSPHFVATEGLPSFGYYSAQPNEYISYQRKPTYRIMTQEYSNQPISTDINITLPRAINGNGELEYSLDPVLPDGLQLIGNKITGRVSEQMPAQFYTWKVVDEDFDMNWLSFSLGFSRKSQNTWELPPLNLAYQPPVIYFPYHNPYQTTSEGRYRYVGRDGGTISLKVGENIEKSIEYIYGGTDELTFSVSPSLPDGLELVDGVIRGAPTQVQSPTAYTVMVSNTRGEFSKDIYSITVEENANSIPVFEGNSWSTELNLGESTDVLLPMAADGDLDWNWELDYQMLPKVPDGLRIECHRLRGAPTNVEDSGVYRMVVSDVDGDSDEIELNINILPSSEGIPSGSSSTTAPETLVVTPSDSVIRTIDEISDGVERVRWEVGSRVDFQFGSSTNRAAEDKSVSLFGRLPDGLVFDGSDSISGVPTGEDMSVADEQDGVLIWSAQSVGEEPEVETVSFTVCKTGCNGSGGSGFEGSGNGVLVEDPFSFLSHQQEVPDTISPRFVDSAGSVHGDNIIKLANLGISQGCDPPLNTQFCPDRVVSRAEIATFLVRVLELEPNSSDFFTDDGQSVHSSNIDSIAHVGLVSGCDPPANKRYCPDRPVSRGELASILTRAYGLESGSAAFKDISSSVHRESIAAIHEAGITQGCDPPAYSKFCPDREVTRAEMATFLVRAMALPDG